MSQACNHVYASGPTLQGMPLFQSNGLNPPTYRPAHDTKAQARTTNNNTNNTLLNIDGDPIKFDSCMTQPVMYNHNAKYHLVGSIVTMPQFYATRNNKTGLG